MGFFKNRFHYCTGVVLVYAVLAVGQEQWTVRIPIVTPENLYGIAYAESTYIAVGSNKSVILSHDGQIWAVKHSGGNDTLRAVTRGADRFAAVGDNGTIIASFDGNSWNDEISATKRPLFCITWSGSQYVAGGDSGTIITSIDGSTWSACSSSTMHCLRAITFSRGRFVAVGDSGTILTSSDGRWWTLQDSVTSEQLRSVTHTDSMFVVVGTRGKLLTSVDGVIWTDTIIGDENGPVNSLTSLAWNGNQFVGVGKYSGICKISMTLKDGIWNTIDLEYGDTKEDLSAKAIVWGNGEFITVGDSGTILSSRCDWQPVSKPVVLRDRANLLLRDIAFGNGMFIAAGEMIFANNRERCYVSADGVIWSMILRQNAYAVCWGNDKFVLSRASGGVSVSSDGINWQECNFSSEVNEAYDAITWGNKSFAASSKWYAGISTDGCMWSTTRFVKALGEGTSIVWGNGLFVAVGYQGNIATSVDGSVWQQQTIGKTVDLYDVTWGNGRFVAVGEDGTIITSFDGMSWEPQTSGCSQSLCHVIYGGDQFVTVGVSGTILSSSEGILWKRQNSGTTYSLSAVEWGDSQYIAVGDSGLILSSPRSVTQAVVSKNRLSADEQIIISPLVRSGKSLIFSCMPNTTGMLSLKLYDAAGHQVSFLKKRCLTSAEQTIAMPLSQIVPGAYLLEAKVGSSCGRRIVVIP